MNSKITSIVLFFTTILFSQENFVIKNVRLFDGEKVIENSFVKIENGKIHTISSTEIQSEIVINGTGKTLLPALTNCHVHIWSPVSLQQAAKAGVLNVLDMHAVESMLPILKSFRTSTNHADYYAAGAAATVPGGHGTQYGFPTPTLTKPEEAAKFVKDRIEVGAHYIKIIKEPWKATLDATTVAAIIKSTHLQKKKAVVHISKVEDAYQVLTDKADGLVHIWDNDAISEEQLRTLQKKTFFVIPTLLTIQKVQDVYHKKTAKETKQKMVFVQKEVKRLYDAKIPILAGTDPPNANINYGTDLYKEMLLLQEAEIPILAVLKSATSLPAVHFNLENKGFIKEGYRADIILVDGNPTENINDITNKKRIWKQGIEIK